MIWENERQSDFKYGRLATADLHQRGVQRLGCGRWGWGIGGEQQFMVLWHHPCLYSSFMHAELFEPVKRVEDHLPVVVSEVVLDLANVVVCCQEPICGGELIRTRYVVAGVV